VRALRSQDYPADRHELIFVDNASTDASPGILEAAGDALRVIREGRRGASAARNAGVAAARFDWIAFTDADCVPREDWLHRLVTHATGHAGVDFVGGSITAFEPGSAVERFAERLFDQRASIEDETPPYAITANLLVRSSMLQRLGGFDPAGLRGQDVDLSFRAFLDHDARFSYAADAIVAHCNVDTVGGLFRKGIQHGRAAAFIYGKYSARLGCRPWRACIHPARYARILTDLRSSAVGAARSAWRTAALGDEAVRYPAYSAVFAIGKQVGLVLGNLSGGANRLLASGGAGSSGARPPGSGPATGNTGGRF
jgi:glycosyltransferase involved in cell wall biosynthesis